MIHDTDIILSPDQPDFYPETGSEHFNDFYEEKEEDIEPPPKKSHYPYEEPSDDEFEIEETLGEEIEDDSENSEYNSFSNDDYDTDADGENSDSSQVTADQNDILQENIQAREVEINNLIEDQEDLGAVGGHDEDENFDQSRQPKQGDIVSFVYKEYWVTAKIKRKPNGPETATTNLSSHRY